MSKHFSEEDIQMVNRYIKKFSEPLIGEMHIIILLMLAITLVRMIDINTSENDTYENIENNLCW